MQTAFPFKTGFYKEKANFTYMILVFRSGLMKIDLLISGSQVFNVYKKSFEKVNVAILGSKFFYVGNDITGLEPKEMIDGTGKYLIPGLVDIHLHIESTMLTPKEFSKGIIKYGTTTAVTDPHEIANVFGLEGVETMIELPDGPADIFYGVPSSVPSTPFETTGGVFDVAEVRSLAKNPKVLCLGEVMNFHDLASESETKTKNLIRVMHENNPRPIIEGHCPRLSGQDLQKFLYAGVDGDHTQQTIESLREKIGLGMFIELQEKSLTTELLQVIVDEKMTEHCCLVTDDTMVDALYFDGHLSRIYRKAVALGLPTEEALYLCTYTPARRMGLTDRGSIAPGRLADFVIVTDLASLEVDSVYKNGQLVQGEVEEIKYERIFPSHFYKSVNLGELFEKDFEIVTGQEKVECRVMQMNSQSTFTDMETITLPVQKGKVSWEESGVALVAVFDRYTGKNKAFGFARGACLKQGAVATTYAHDHHNLLVLGHSIADMLLAANRVIEIQGGMVAVANGEKIAEITLPVAGILSDLPLKEVASQMKEFKKALEDLGWEHHNPIMSLGTLSLPVSPALKISDQGLIDVREGKIISLFI